MTSNTITLTREQRRDREREHGRRIRRTPAQVAADEHMERIRGARIAAADFATQWSSPGGKQ